MRLSTLLSISSLPLVSAGGAGGLPSFEQWVENTGVTVPLGQEGDAFRAAFHRTAKEVQAHNEQAAPLFLREVNKFAASEPPKGYRFSKAQRLGAVMPPPTQEELKDLPDSIDWRLRGAVSPVKNQGDAGTCWSFSTVGSIEGASVLRNGNKLESLSNQYLIDCIHNGGDSCNTETNTMTMAFDFLVSAGGKTYTYDSYPYVDGECVFWDPPHGCHINKTQVVVPNLNVTGYTHTVVGDEDSLKQAVALGPVSVAIDANGISTYKSGVFDGQCQNTADALDHAVLVVGYGTDSGVDYWTIKNSWGEEWGEKGFFRLIRGKNKCGVAIDASYPTVANTTSAATPF